MTGTPEDGAARLLEDVLSVIHLSGSLILRAELTAPWAYETRSTEELKQLLTMPSEWLIAFHIFLEGRCWVRLDGGEPVDLQAGDVVVLPYANQHRVGSPGATDVIPIGQLLPPQPWTAMPEIHYGGGGERTTMVCGYLQCDDLLFNPFLRALPNVFRVRPAGGGPVAAWMRASIEYALAGAPPAATRRLYEVIFIEAMRHFAAGLAPEQTGWLAALGDPIVGRALTQLHAAPAEAWTVDELARRVATSRSVLDDRFRRRLGRAPMRYLTEWRLQLAADLLRSSRLAVAEVASRVGYESEASFNRAFRRHLGEPPARWRQASRDGERRHDGVP